ncbi:glycosyl transferase [Ureibacillus sinduriensis BLB-1 = JCM 15800]|uniref:Glycosyl transferase n=1 Tax=Ureibacillus sinduriensis BLB-1 = JCM 15800 TaxID=1384057 RepID=A0A0A3HUL1_9BACL|nr:glycosyl transferase [Ureibacillus sinduriensis BLB-1 = JCM 15800]
MKKSYTPCEKIPTCKILGVNIAAINMEWLVNFLVDHIKSLSGQYICVSNVHTTVMGYEESDYRAILNNSLMSIPDGGPLSTIGRRWGYVKMSRTTGPDLMKEIFELSSNKGYRHYFYGSTESTLKKMRINLLKDYPGLDIVGMYSPPFRPIAAMEDEKIMQQINETKPDFIWVGLGAPKQEKWMAYHKDKINGLMIGVGAGFDYYAENIKRAPLWMQKFNLEWLYRLLQDPKRLFKRYLRTNIKFLWLIKRGV